MEKLANKKEEIEKLAKIIYDGAWLYKHDYISAEELIEHIQALATEPIKWDV
jgi:hypothetical protein